MKKIYKCAALLFLLASTGKMEAQISPAPSSAAGAALNFDGIDDNVYIGPGWSSSLVGTDKLTIEAWVRPTTLSGAGSIISNHASGTQFALRRTNDYFDAFVGFGTHAVISTAGTATLNTWQHVASVFDGTSLKLYINGELVASSTFSQYTFASTSTPIKIGNNGFNEVFGGDMDEIRVWNVARTQCDIKNYRNCEIPASSSGLLANYHFNQGAAGGDNTSISTLTDMSGNGYHGSLDFFTFDLNGPASNFIAPGGVTSGSTTPSSTCIDPTKLITAQCNTTLTVLDGTVRLYCDKVSTATNYEWQFTDVSTGNVVFTKQRGWQWTDFYLTGYWPTIQYNKTYSIKIRAYVGGTWTSYGTACTITTPAAPVMPTQLTSAFCNQTLSSLNSTTKIYCNPVQGATDYEWQFSNPSTGQVLFTKRRLAQYSDFYLKGYWSAIQLNRTYNVTIRAYVNGQWSSFGPTCTLTTPSQFSKETYTDAQIARLLMGESEEAIGMENQLNLITIYPNPAKDVLNIESPIEVKNIIVTNLAGQKVAEYANTNSINIANLVNGIYFINVSTNEGSKNFKVIKD